MRVLYSGWSLTRDPIGPESLHLQAILANLPDEIKPLVVLPEAAPAWLEDLETHLHPMLDTPLGRLRWEQVQLPWMARKFGIKLLHLASPAAPVLGNMLTLLSPSSFGAGLEDYAGVGHSSPESIQFLTRLRRSLAHGGMVQVKEILWPQDLPPTGLPGALTRLPPILPLGFIPGQLTDSDKGGNSAAALLEQLGLPETFIIYHGPGDRRSLERLMRAWNWAAAAIGESYPLLVLGLDCEARSILSGFVEQYDLEGSLHLMLEMNPEVLPNLYQRCSAVFHPAPPSPWAGPVRLALACGRPLVASENSITDAIAGPAAYLAPEGDARALGAALVTVIVEEQVAESLSAAALQRVKNWRSPRYAQQLLQVYSRVLTESDY